MLNSEQPANTIGSVLTRRFQQVGDVVKVGRGVWGLKEWYPNRSFNRPSKAEPTPEPLDFNEGPQQDRGRELVERINRDLQTPFDVEPDLDDEIPF